jgi:hypothetical protein
VRRAEGDLVRIEEADVVAGKPIPPRPARRTPRGIAAAGERLAAIGQMAGGVDFWKTEPASR